MGTKVEIDNCFPGYHSMRDLNGDSNGGGFPAYYGDTRYPNGQYYYGFLPRGNSDTYLGTNKDIVKQKMLEHEAIFKNQVYELHRLYRVQRDLMDEFKRKEGCKLETSSSSSPLPSQMLSEDARKWNISSFPSSNPLSIKAHVSALARPETSACPNKGKSVQFSPIPSQNCCSPKDSEASESRPSKSRRKMIDLQLPADVYIDTDEFEQCGEVSHPPGLNHNLAPYDVPKLLTNHFEKTESIGNGTISHLRKSNPLADLNEPFVVEEHTSFPLVDISSTPIPQNGGHTRFLGLPREIPQNSQHGSINEISNTAQLESNGNCRGWFSSILEAERSREKLTDMMPGPSKPVQCILDSARHPPSFSPSNHMEDSWRTKLGSLRNYFQSGGYDSESYLLAQRPSPSSFSHTSDLVNTWNCPMLSWERPSSLLIQKPILAQPNPFMTSATFSRNSMQSKELLLNSGIYNSNIRANLDFGNEMPVRNGFNHGSSSGSKELPSRVNDDKRALGSGDCFMILSPHVDVNSRKDINLNVVNLNGFSTYQNNQQLMRTMDRTSRLEDRHPELPWLAGKGACLKEALSPKNAVNSLGCVLQNRNELSSKNDLRKTLDRLNSLASTSCNGPRHEGNDHLTGRMILGIPVYETPVVIMDEAASSAAGPSSDAQPTWNKEIIASSGKAGFDINVPYVPMESEYDKATDEVVLSKKIGAGGASFRNHIDLNSCASDEDVPPVNSHIKHVIDIDLESPASPESGDDEFNGEVAAPEVPRDSGELAMAHLVKVAAEAIVDISAYVNMENVVDPSANSTESSSENPLHWFANMIFENDSVNHFGAIASKPRPGGIEEDCLSSDSGYFESMTLKLKECDAEEYLSKPSQVLNLEGMGTNGSGSRPRRGPSRRGRQRRDFQRDILPGLTTLSRHEVTEDLQTFGGLMRAMGHAWHSGPRRNATRNGCARGRRRSVAGPATPLAANTVCALLRQQQSNNTTTTSSTSMTNQVRLEDRSLTGWGRTTRRPRRQRFPAGNPAAIALT